MHLFSHQRSKPQLTSVLLLDQRSISHRFRRLSNNQLCSQSHNHLLIGDTLQVLTVTYFQVENQKTLGIWLRASKHLHISVFISLLRFLITSFSCKAWRFSLMHPISVLILIFFLFIINALTLTALLKIPCLVWMTNCWSKKGSVVLWPSSTYWPKLI